MLTELVIAGFQSLRDVRIAFGKFTVVTGPTSSGKSSLIRAVQLVTFNARGTSYISRGAKSCQVLLGSQEQAWAVAIERGGGRDAYRIVRLVNEPMSPEGYMDEPCVDEFTKLGGKVPYQVEALLNLRDINFAGQFDRPYLLAESAGEVARTLGQLTNVTLIFEAAREASRRKAQLAADLKQAERELYSVRQELPRFQTLPLRLAALRRAQEAQIATAGLQQRGTRLQALLSQYSAAQAQLDAIHTVPVPDLSTLEAAVARAARLQELVIQYEHWAHEADAGSSYIEAMQSMALEAQDNAAKLLREAGRCPTCGQAVHDSSGHRGNPGSMAVPAPLEEDAGEHTGS